MGDTLPKKILRLLWCIFIFALPFRWNYAVTSAEQALFPMNALEWLFFAIQPHFLLCVIAGVLLLCTLALYPTPPQRDASLSIPILALSPLLFGLAGLVNTTEIEYATNWYWHFYAIACVSIGLWWTSRYDEKILSWGLHAIAIGGLVTAFQGWTQHFGGLEAQLQAQLENAKATGVTLTEQMIAKFRQTRSYGSFADPNAYAAQLLISCPFMILDAIRIGKRCTTPRPACILLGGTASVLFFGALMFSGSRGAVLGAICGCIVFAAFAFGKRLTNTWKISLAVIAVICACGMVLVINKLSQRKMETVTIRMEYYRTALNIYKEHPFFGAGLGEFFPWHLRLKPWDGDEARDPHSLFFSQLSQCGLPGAFDAALRLIAPFLLALGLFKASHHKDSWQIAATLGAWCAWNAHALTQFNDIVISTSTIAGFTGLFIFAPPSAQTQSSSRKPTVWAYRCIIILMSAVALLSLIRIPGEKAKQIADNFRSSGASYPTCKDALEKAMRLQPHGVLSSKLMADMALQMNDLTTAEKAIDHLMRISPHRAATHLRTLRLAIMKQDSDAEKEALASLEQWYPTSPELWMYKACQSTPFKADLLALRYEKIHADSSEVLFSVNIPPQMQNLAGILPKQIYDGDTGKNIRFELHQ